MNLLNHHSRHWLHKRALLIAAFFLMGLAVLFSFYYFTKPSLQAERNSLQHYIHQQQKDFQQLLADTAIMRRLLQQTETLKQFEELDEKPYGIFLFAETLDSTPQFLFWNDYKILPPVPDFEQADGEYFKELENGYYVIEKRTIQLEGISSNVIAFSMIPVMSKYQVKTSYLFDHFAHSDDAHNKIAIAEDSTAYPVKSIRNKELFYIQKKANSKPANSSLIIMLQVAALVLLLAFVHFTAERIIVKRDKLSGIGFLALVLILIRALMYLFPDLFFFHQSPLFYVDIFDKNNWLQSLGDLLINALFFCWISVFAWLHLAPSKKLPVYLKGNWVVVAGMVAVLLLLWSTFLLAHTVKTLVAHSEISFYVNDFFTLDYNTVIGFIVLALLSLGYYYLTRLLFNLIFLAFKKPIYIYFILALAGLLYLTFVPSVDTFEFQLAVLGWLIIYSLLMGREHFLFNRFRVNIASVLFWIIVFSASLAAVMLKENLEKEWEQRKEFAGNLISDSSPSVLNVLNIGIQYIDNRFLLNNLHRFADPAQQALLRDSILNFSLSPGFEDYKVQLYLFDSTSKGIYNDDDVSFFELNEIYTTRSNPTLNPDIFRHEKRQSEFTYITKRTIRDSTGLLGSLFIISTPKRFKGEGFSFELLGQIDEKKVEMTQKYDFAIYQGIRLDSSSSYTFPFPTVLMEDEIPPKGFSRKTVDNYQQLWFNAGPDLTDQKAKQNPDKIAVVIKKQDSVVEGITLFSYLFCSFLLMIGLLHVLSVILKSGNSWRALQSFWQLNIRSQIQGIIIFISVLSFIIIGVVTISFFIERYNRNNQEELTRISESMVNEIERSLPPLEDEDPERDSTYVLPDIDSTALIMQSLVDRVAAINSVDVNLYDISGNVVYKSAADVFDMGLLSTKMHPKAFYHLNRQQQVQYLQNETMSSLQFQSIYRAVRDQQGKTRYYLNIPFYTSEFELEQEISNFLVAIINLNAFVFLIAGTIAVVITNRITRSFFVIGDKMKAITLGRTNEEIEWKRNDEIGELIKQYNKMVRQLEQSAEALAKSEREGAWREMARQVAHEIKNPLTPMKLSIQYLQKAITNGQPNVKDLTTNVASTLIEQIDHLSKIAADFGRFANIGNRNLEVFDLHNVLESLKDLYSSNPDITLVWKKADEEVTVEADRTHMNRLFTNLLTNAIDACSNQSYCHIEIREEIKDNNILVQVKDNGEGIPEEMQPKIFTPNFTTKSSGTGLGLAICKSIVEQAGGDIWFETAQGTGTSFYVQLPLANSF